MKLNALLGTEFPIIHGGMANIATAPFAAAVSSAGALGLIGAGGMDAHTLRQHIRQCRELTDKPFGVNIMLMNPAAAEMAQVVVEEQVPVVTTGAGSPAPYMDAWKKAGIKVIPVVAAPLLAKRLENYGADAILSGAEPIYVPLVPPEYNFDLSLIEDGFRQGAKGIIVCNPSNPCGKVFTREELMGIGELALKYDAFVITDEVYEHMVYAPNHHVCMASLPGMYEHTITCNSLSKTYSITGWRLGYLIGPEDVVEGAKKVHDFLTVGAPAPLQEAAVTGLNFPQSYYDDLLALYTAKRKRFLDGLDKIGLKHNIPQGTYFVMVDIQDFLNLPQFAGYSDLEFCEWMIREIGVAAVPGSSFFREPVNNLIRLHFARSEETIDEALRRLSRMSELLK